MGGCADRNVFAAGGESFDRTAGSLAARDTKLFPSILASVILTAFSTLFNFYVMRRGVLIVGAGRHSLGKDLQKLPRLVVDFVTWIPRFVIRRAARKLGSGRPDGD